MIFVSFKKKIINWSRIAHTSISYLQIFLLSSVASCFSRVSTLNIRISHSKQTLRLESSAWRRHFVNFHNIWPNVNISYQFLVILLINLTNKEWQMVFLLTPYFHWKFSQFFSNDSYNFQDTCTLNVPTVKGGNS